MNNRSIFRTSALAVNCPKYAGIARLTLATTNGLRLLPHVMECRIAVSVSINYSFPASRYRMPAPPKTPCIAIPGRRGVPGQSRSALRMPAPG